VIFRIAVKAALSGAVYAARLEALANPLAVLPMTMPDVAVIPIAPALVMAPYPATPITMPWNPHPTVPFVPVVRAMVIWPVTDTDREIDCFRFGREHRSGAPQHHGQQHYHFLFHTHLLSFGRHSRSGRYFFAFFVVSFFAAASRSVFFRREARFLTLSLPWLFPIIASASPFRGRVPNDFPQISRTRFPHEQIRRLHLDFHSPEPTPVPPRSFALCAIFKQWLDANSDGRRRGLVNTPPGS
jgi:hypothetical protein